jgi:hypothetical protein
MNLKSSLLLVVFILLNLFDHTRGSPYCTGEVPDVCGYYPSTYGNLTPPADPPSVFCFVNCTIGNGFDLCEVCGGPAPITRTLLTPSDYIAGTFMGGSVANWNGSVAISQYLRVGEDALYTPSVAATVLVWTLNHTTNLYSLFEIPSSTDGTYIHYLPEAKGYALCMSEDYLVIGSYDTNIKLMQLWVKSYSPPYFFKYTAVEECPGNRYGYSVGIDQRKPKTPSQSSSAIIVVGDPGAEYVGQVYVYFSDSNGLSQTLMLPNGTSADQWCFGEAVSADSGFLAVGSPSYPTGTQTNSGLVVVYLWDPTIGIEGAYVELVQIQPPTPAFNGGFGLSVSIWENLLMVGDNQGAVYQYVLIGNTALLIGLDQPAGLSTITTFGQSVSVWEMLATAGDGYFDASPSASGMVQVWTPDALAPFFIPRWQFTDDLTSQNTHFGRAVDVRGGCYLAAGTINEAPYGGVWVINLCKGPCYGCDGVLNSCVQPDYCGVCDGDNSTCTDCRGVIGGPARVDACGVCAGTNNTCLLPTPLTITTPCNSTSGPYNLTYAWQSKYGTATWTLASLPSKGVVTLSVVFGKTYLTYQASPYVHGTDSFTLNVTQSNLHLSELLVVSVNLGSCLDCLGVMDGPTVPDVCFVCGGDNTTCAGCDGIPWSNKTLDYCDVCNGNNRTCINITTSEDLILNCVSETVLQLTYEPKNIPAKWYLLQGTHLGHISLTSAGLAKYTNNAVSGMDWFVVKVVSNYNASVFEINNISITVLPCEDCNGVQLGTQINDACGVCGGDSSSCADCAGIPNGTTPIDICGKCAGDGTSCLDCLGIVNGTTPVVCGVCNGTRRDCPPPTTSGFTVGMVILIFIIGISVLILLGYAVIFVYTNWTTLTAITQAPPPKNLYDDKSPTERKVVKNKVLGTFENMVGTDPEIVNQTSQSLISLFSNSRMDILRRFLNGNKKKV